MEEHTDEIYERIPWETIENSGKDRQWVAIGVAAALVAGALGYSFISNRTTALPPAPAVAAEVENPAPAPVVPPVAASAPTTSPVVVSEADLYAIPPDQLAREAAAHAEWFLIEYLTVDGLATEDPMLRSLLPAHVPLPSATDGGLVFVEWVGASGVEEVEPGVFRVEVSARYMVAADGASYERVAPESFSIDVVMTDAGPVVAAAPVASPALPVAAPGRALSEVPEVVGLTVLEMHPGSDIVGGEQMADGSWRVTFMTSGTGGITRPESMVVVP